MDLAPTIYVEAVAKFAKVNVGSAETSSVLCFSVDFAESLTDALANLPTIDRSSKPEIVVVFSYDTQGESLYVRPSNVVSLNARILKEDDSQDEDVFNQPRRVLLAPAIFICDSAGFVNVQGFTTNSQTRVWFAHCTMYLPSTGRSFRKSVMDPRPVVHLIHCYPRAMDQREEFHTFSEFSGIKKELDPYWDESLKAPFEDWADGKCGVALPLLKQALLPALKKYDYRVVNIWGGRNVIALALVSALVHPLLIYVPCLCIAGGLALMLLTSSIVSADRRYHCTHSF